MQGGGGKVVGAVVKSKLGEFEDEVREGFYRRLSNYLTGVVQLFSDNVRLLLRFQYLCENYLT